MYSTKDAPALADLEAPTLGLGPANAPRLAPSFKVLAGSEIAALIESPACYPNLACPAGDLIDLSRDQRSGEEQDTLVIRNGKKIHGDMAIGAREARLERLEITGNVRFTGHSDGQTVYLEGVTISGDVTLSPSSRLKLGAGSVVEGEIRYEAHAGRKVA